MIISIPKILSFLVAVTFSVGTLECAQNQVQGQAQGSGATLVVDLAHPGVEISPSMYGVFFEDINFAADGGLYPELVKNRSFEFQEPLTGWHETLPFNPEKGLDQPRGELDVRTDGPLNATNPHYLRSRIYEPGYSFYNTGFHGIGLESGAEYRFSAFVRSHGPTALRATLTNSAHKEIGSGTLKGSMEQGSTTKPLSTPALPSSTHS